MELIKSTNTTFKAEQDKDAFLDYAIDWSDWLLKDDTIISSDWQSDDGLTLSSAFIDGACTTVWVQGGIPNRWYNVTNTVKSKSGRIDQRTFQLHIVDEKTELEGTALFPDMGKAVESLKNNQLAITSCLPQTDFSEDYLAAKLRAAEADAERRLRVFFSETVVFAYEPTQQEIDELPEGMRWHEEAAYDYEPSLWTSEDWGYLVLRKTPVLAVEKCMFCYPAPTTGFFTVPDSWIRVDKKAGHIRFVPSGSALGMAPLTGFVISALGGGCQIPDMIRLRYRAGLRNAAKDYPDLVDIVRKMAVLRILHDAYLPQSGSISADGLSQSTSLQMAAFQDEIDSALDHLAQSIHGVSMVIL